MSDPHPMDKSTPESLRLLAGELFTQVEEGVQGQTAPPGELQTLAVHASMLLLRADTLEVKAMLKVLTDDDPMDPPEMPAACPEHLEPARSPPFVAHGMTAGETDTNGVVRAH